VFFINLRGGLVNWVCKIFVLLILFSFNANASDFHAKKPWVYFDLGNTIVNTNNIKNLHYMRGSREYMEQLKKEGFNIGIISNIPESWGNTYEEKLQSLKTYIYFGWGEATPFDWSVFDEVILPLSNAELKPAPFLYLKAISKTDSCPSVFIGENIKEVNAAKEVGMATKLYIESDEEVYIPIYTLKSYITDNYGKEFDPNCLL
jgi:FMN phosphatase YigB (HAD superfamily)